ncbi:MAG TPA: glycosyltransferase [Ferruginibacter sp.]|nr:glycosyltransferase [Ferruginibacter sp.]
MILVDALYINNGGGKILLEYLIKTLQSQKIEVHYLLDDRLPLEDNEIPAGSFTQMRASISERIKFYKKNVSAYKNVLCFGNVPPPIKLPIPVYTYFHQYLFVNVPKNYDWKTRLKYKIKYLVIKRFSKNSNFWIVQSSSFKQSFINRYQTVKEDNVLVIPFYPPIEPSDLDIKREAQSFIYVSDGSHHKNHHNLLEAFKIYYDNNKTGELYLTVAENFADIWLLIKKYQAEGYPIINVGFVDRNELFALYKKCKYSIYPSFAESFGLGVLEAIENGCMIIGADLPYMHAICKPSVLFDPSSVESMSAAIESTLKKEPAPSEIIATNNINQLIKILN